MKKSVAALVAVATIAGSLVSVTPAARAGDGVGAGIAAGLLGGEIVGGAIAGNLPLHGVLCAALTETEEKSVVTGRGNVSAGAFFLSRRADRLQHGLARPAIDLQPCRF